MSPATPVQADSSAIGSRPGSALAPDPATRAAAEVSGMFARLVPVYDRLNRLMTGGFDQLWRRILVDAALAHGAQDILDLAAGTGDVALELQSRGCRVTACDFCAPMLAAATAKGVKKTVLADATALPFPDQSFDAVTVAWGFRNFSDRAAATREVRRVLRPGGRFAILESSEPSGWSRPFHRFYCGVFVPAMGSLLARDRSAYRYLAHTIRDFPKPAECAEDLRKLGFPRITWQVLGFGAVTLYCADTA